MLHPPLRPTSKQVEFGRISILGLRAFTGIPKLGLFLIRRIQGVGRGIVFERSLQRPRSIAAKQLTRTHVHTSMVAPI